MGKMCKLKQMREQKQQQNIYLTVLQIARHMTIMHNFYKERTQFGYLRRKHSLFNIQHAREKKKKTSVNSRKINDQIFL